MIAAGVGLLAFAAGLVLGLRLRGAWDDVVRCCDDPNDASDYWGW